MGLREPSGSSSRDLRRARPIAARWARLRARSETLGYPDDMRHEESSSETPEGLRLYQQSWRGATTKAAIVLVHGYAEHSGRYEHVAERFTNAGYAIHTFDLHIALLEQSPGGGCEIFSWVHQFGLKSLVLLIYAHIKKLAHRRIHQIGLFSTLQNREMMGAATEFCLVALLEMPGHIPVAQKSGRASIDHLGLACLPITKPHFVCCADTPAGEGSERKAQREPCVELGFSTLGDQVPDE